VNTKDPSRELHVPPQNKPNKPPSKDNPKARDAKGAATTAPAAAIRQHKVTKQNNTTFSPRMAPTDEDNTVFVTAAGDGNCYKVEMMLLAGVSVNCSIGKVICHSY
jgi:hypothetical protein